MKKIFAILIFISLSFAARCDVIFFPRQYSLLCYSAELIYSYEKIKRSKNTTVFWGGAGCVGSFLFTDQPAFGLEAAIEKRHYFKSETYNHFFISAYLGTAYMTDFRYAYDVGVIPGIKINYKAQISPNTILEPYISLSVPIMYDTRDKSGFFPIPVLTAGARFGLFRLKDN